jgi:hypothetical protein
MPINCGAHHPNPTCDQLRRACHAEDINNETILKTKSPDSDRPTQDIRKTRNNRDTSNTKKGKTPSGPAGHGVGLVIETLSVGLIIIAFRCHLVAKVFQKRINVNLSLCS